ncbi:hypothetical protein LHJ74_08930 [Streptomyces sp. N2-109]|uniref:Uncharacterized protein n=1 Tax=Streptomyces gossypii TaxID=2883101 RepID=A0ABT2JS11_9ACTN|nr:hypothetical protein [Streptomyces gossypii]MCT2590034.1 hypothetical protein [Streptomyces gossypii]
MPTPYGSRGGMAFSADELRVLRGALAVALQPAPVHSSDTGDTGAYRQLAEALDEAVREGSRLRSFVLADLARDRAALPGSAAGYLEQLEDALAAGYLPRPDDLAALRLLCADPAGPVEAARRAELLRRGERLAARAVRARLLVLPGGRSALSAERTAGGSGHPRAGGPDEAPEEAGEETGEQAPGENPAEPPAVAPASAPEERPDEAPEKPPAKRPAKKPAAPPEAPAPSRPVPTPAEVFPPRRRPAEPPQEALPDWGCRRSSSPWALPAQEVPPFLPPPDPHLCCAAAASE